MKKNRILSIAFVLWAASGFAQVKSPAVEQQIQDSFNLYQARSLPEKLFVHTDKSVFTAGELLWFKIYNQDGLYLKPLSLSKVVYVEVLDNNQNAVLQTKIAMNNATGNGSLYIPLTVATGSYILRAYTSWMKNFSPDLYFTKKLTIINPLKSPEKNPKDLAATYDVQFFPEGGKLVAGINSVVAFKATDRWGNGVNFKGAIINQKDDTIVKFSPLKFGMGHFAFKPDSGSAYRAVVNINGANILKELPAISSKGYVMNLKDEGNGQLLVSVQTNLPAKNLYLFAQTRNTSKAVASALSNDGISQFTIDKSMLGEGISQITIFNTERQPVCERLYFKRPATVLNITASANAPQYDTRKKVEVNIGTNISGSKAIAADLSMSVYKLDSLQSPDQEDIFGYLWLRSDLGGFIESPDYYFKNTGAEADEAADNLMLTQGWRSFDWNNVLSGKVPGFTFLPEFDGPLIAAKISDPVTNKPADGVLTYLGVTGKSVQLAVSKSDGQGRLFFNMKNFYGPAEVVAETNTEIDTNYRIDILSPFSEQFARVALPDLKITPGMQATFEDQSLVTQVQNVYSSNNMQHFYDPHADSSAFYGTPYKIYLLDNYTRFTTTEEVMREFIREANVSHLHNHFHVKVPSGIGFLSEHDPLMLVDGIPFFNVNKVFALDPLKIRKIETVPYDYVLGASMTPGIFSFTSYKGDLAGAEIDPHAVIVDYEGLQKQRHFYTPLYETAQQSASHMPDFRNVLYWSPSVSTGVNGKNTVSFYTSDQTGHYIGIIQGITSNGEAGSQAFTFEVRPGYSAQEKK